MAGRVVLPALLLLGLVPGAAEAAERRCGWLWNPTPGNYWLDDREGRWVLSAQGGHGVPGMEDIPDMTIRGWVATNGAYGYGCACLVMETERAGRRVLRLVSAEPLPLSRCGADASLPRPRD